MRGLGCVFDWRIKSRGVILVCAKRGTVSTLAVASDHCDFQPRRGPFAGVEFGCDLRLDPDREEDWKCVVPNGSGSEVCDLRGRGRGMSLGGSYHIV